MSQFSVGMLNLIKDLTNQNLKFYNPIYIIPYSYYCCDANTHTSIGIMHHNAWQTTKRKPCIHISLTVQGKATFTFTYALLTCSMYHFLSGTESFHLQLFDDYSFCLWSLSSFFLNFDISWEILSPELEHMPNLILDDYRFSIWV